MRDRESVPWEDSTSSHNPERPLLPRPGPPNLTPAAVCPPEDGGPCSQGLPGTADSNLAGL